jgi:hypothetical protein
MVATELETSGFDVVLAAPQDLHRFGAESSFVFSMSRSPEVLERLNDWAAQGRAVVNQADAVVATARSALARRRFGTLVQPAAHVVSTSRGGRGDLAALLGRADWWVKGGDLYASRREDVQRVETMHALERVLDDFDRRGISTAVLQEHVTGREIKFYAVGGASFFHWLDAAQPAIHGSEAYLFQRAVIAAGTALSLEIFGGDIVIGESGQVTMIDLNDWPSFAPCREAGARAIARYLEARLVASYTAASPAGSVAPSLPT